MLAGQVGSERLGTRTSIRSEFSHDFVPAVNNKGETVTNTIGNVQATGEGLHRRYLNRPSFSDLTHGQVEAWEPSPQHLHPQRPSRTSDSYLRITTSTNIGDTVPKNTRPFGTYSTHCCSERLVGVLQRLGVALQPFSRSEPIPVAGSLWRVLPSPRLGWRAPRLNA